MQVAVQCPLPRARGGSKICRSSGAGFGCPYIGCVFFEAPPGFGDLEFRFAVECVRGLLIAGAIQGS